MFVFCSYLNKEYGKEIPDFTLRVIKGNVHPAYQNFFKQFLETEVLPTFQNRSLKCLNSQRFLTSGSKSTGTANDI
jgi:hypothetical protein